MFIVSVSTQSMKDATIAVVQNEGDDVFVTFTSPDGNRTTILFDIDALKDFTNKAADILDEWFDRQERLQRPIGGANWPNA